MCNMSGSSLMGFGLGMLAGAAVALLAAPMRGDEMRARLRASAEARRSPQGAMRRQPPLTSETTSLSATLGEIAQMHAGVEPGERKAWS